MEPNSIETPTDILACIKACARPDTLLGFVAQHGKLTTDAKSLFIIFPTLTEMEWYYALFINLDEECRYIKKGTKKNKRRQLKQISDWASKQIYKIQRFI